MSRYLACCLAHDDPRAFRHILALTFTNKAAWEMKERILSDLARVGSGERLKILFKNFQTKLASTPKRLRNALAL